MRQVVASPIPLRGRKEDAVRLRLLFVSLVVVAGFGAGTAAAAAVCTGDACVISGGFAGLQADISTSGAPPAVTQLLASQVAFAERLHPPGPCLVGDLHPPNPCLPAYRYFASAAVLVLVDAEVRVLGGFAALGCAGGCGLSPASARLIDGDIRTLLADPGLYPPGLPSLPAIPPGPPA
jgi:hypothetical protein